MKHNPVIRKGIAFLMVLLFLFSITPKKYWHDLLASHTDTYAGAVAGKTSLSTKGFNCHADDLVVNTPFIESSQASASPLSPADAPKFTLNPVRPVLHNSKTKDSRGPPAVV